eukprot:gene27058-45224_t
MLRNSPPPHSLVVYREGTESVQPNADGKEGGWVLREGSAATVVRVTGDNLVLDNGVCRSAPLHAALWWQKGPGSTFLVIDDVFTDREADDAFAKAGGRTGSDPFDVLVLMQCATDAIRGARPTLGTGAARVWGDPPTAVGA